MGYKKFSEEREAKRGFQHSPEMKSRETDNNEIQRLIKEGAPLFSAVINRYGWNAVVRATEHAPGRRQRKRRATHAEYADV